MPADADHSWTVSLVGRGNPMTIGMLHGTQSRPTKAVHWRDLALEGGQVAELVMTPAGAEILRVDSDGDGTVDRVVPPTSDVSGDEAADTEAPLVSLVSVPVMGQRRLVVTATDQGGSGVESIWYSTDGRTFETYADPFIAPDRGPVLAFAEDRAGNRSPMAELAVDEAVPGALTRATVTPKPNSSGWTIGDTTVRLAASSDSSSVTEVQWRTTGAQETELTSVPGADAEVQITEPGRTTVAFRSVTEDGTVEPWREQVVRVDGADPTGRLRSPAAGAATPSLTQLAGTADDDASGVADVEVLLERTLDGTTWDGDSWVEDRSWLATDGTTTWRTTSVPTGAELEPGGYAVRVRVTDVAGRIATGQASTFTVAHAGRLNVHPLPLAPGTQGYTSGSDINDDGVVVGLSGDFEGPTRWVNGVPELLELPAGITEAQPTAIGSDGAIAGHRIGSGPGQAIRWDTSGTPHLLPSLPGHEGVQTTDISAAGVVGTVGTQPVWWPEDDRVVALEMRGSDRSGTATGIDDHGTIVGSVVDADGATRAVAWTDGGRSLSLLGSLGGTESYATAVNEVGQVVGTAQRADGKWQPFILDLWSGGPMVEHYVPTTSAPVPHDVADDATIVGEYRSSTEEMGFAIVDGQFRATWDLLPADSPWSINRFNGINEPGQMTGFGFDGERFGGFIATRPHAPTARDAVVDTDAGTPVEVTLAATDPDPGTTLTRTVLTGPTHGTLSAISGDRVTYTPEPGFNGTDSFIWRGHDGALASDLATVTVRVRPGADTNQRPVAVITAPETAPEGGLLVMDASGSYDSDGTVVSYAWDLDGDGQYDDAAGAVVEARELREGVRTISLLVTDDDGATGSATWVVRVVNVAPLVSVPPTATVTAGDTFELAGSFADPGQDEWTATVDIGDGNGRLPMQLDGREFRLPLTFDEAGQYRVEVRVCDEADCGAATTVVTVSERLAARIDGPATAREGDRIALDGSGSTGSAVTYDWDLDGDGQYDDASGAEVSAVLEQDGEQIIGLRVTDGEGATSEATHRVTVTNVLPVVVLPATATAVVGRPWQLSGTFTDPGADVWTARVDMGQGDQTLPLTGRTFELTHTFASAGTQSVRVTVCDDHGCATALVEVTVSVGQQAWPWQGFFAPVDPMPVVNTVKAGQAIPMKFSLGGDRGLAIFAEDSPVSVRHGCNTIGGTDAIESTVNPGGAQLTYHQDTQRYQYVWKTQKKWAGQCRTFRMVLRDGSVHEAEFKFH